MTGENEKRFEEWLNDGRWFCNTPFKLNLRSFERLPHEMQKGVIEAYYDSLDLVLDVMYIFAFKQYTFELENKEGTLNLPRKEYLFKSRKEATIAAFEEADKLINKTL